jgi:catechol 2,3-dioxygenase-like lactoylglutathione lyase family enzyme
MLSDANVQPMLPVRDLENARRFYHDVLGLEEVGEEPGEAVVYRTGDTTLCVYRSQFAGTNKGTAALWEVDDVQDTIDALKKRGVTFEHYDDMPGLISEGDFYRAGDMAVAWFKDPDGNILSIQNVQDVARRS